MLPRRPPCCETEASTSQKRIIEQTVFVVAATLARSQALSLVMYSCLKAKPMIMHRQASQPVLMDELENLCFGKNDRMRTGLGQRVTQDDDHNVHAKGAFRTMQYVAQAQAQQVRRDSRPWLIVQAVEGDQLMLVASRFRCVGGGHATDNVVI